MDAFFADVVARSRPTTSSRESAVAEEAGR
jgi:hypothetical protein